MFSKQSVLALFLAGASTYELNQIPNFPQGIPDSAKDVLKGFLKGALDEEKFTDLDTCVKDGENVLAGVLEAIKDFKAGGIANIVKAVQELGAVMGEAKHAIADCEQASETDLKRIEEMAALFKHPKDLIIEVTKHVQVYQQDILMEALTAYADYQSQNYYDMGYQLGEAGATVLMGEPAQKTIRATRFVQGLSKSFGAHFNLEAALMCVYEEDQAALSFDMAFQLLEKAVKDKNVKEAIPAVLATLAGYQSMVKGFPVCKSVFSDTWNFEGMMLASKMLTTQHQLLSAKHLENFDIIEDLIAALKAFEEGDFDKAGELIGEIIKKLTGTGKPAPVDPLFLF